MTDPLHEVPIWRRNVAAILDALTAFLVFGYLVARFTGGLTDNGFNLDGGPAFLAFFLVVAYFFVFRRYLGGTLWQRLLRARPR